MKRYIIAALLISAITAAGLSVGGDQWNDRGSSRASAGQFRGQQSRKQPRQQAQKQMPMRAQRSMVQAPVKTVATPMPNQTPVELQYLSPEDRATLDTMQELENIGTFGRETARPEIADEVRKFMREKNIEEYSRPEAYRRAYLRNLVKPNYQQRFRTPDREAYEQLEPNAPAPQSWLEVPEIMGARRRPFYEQLPYMPQESVTPEMAEAYEQMKPSTYTPSPYPMTGWRALDQYLAMPYERSEDDFDAKHFANIMRQVDQQNALRRMSNRYYAQQPKSYKNLWGLWK